MSLRRPRTWIQDIDPTGESVMDKSQGLIGSLKSLSGLRPMRADRLHVLYLEGALLSEKELRIVAEYRQARSHFKEFEPKPRRDGLVQQLPHVNTAGQAS